MLATGLSDEPGYFWATNNSASYQLLKMRTIRIQGIQITRFCSEEFADFITDGLDGELS